MVHWQSTDGTTIEGILVKPSDFSPNRKYPLLVVIHGGTTGVDQPVINADRYYPVERFVAKGALLLRPKLSRIRWLWGNVISGADYLIAQGSVD